MRTIVWFLMRLMLFVISGVTVIACVSNQDNFNVGPSENSQAPFNSPTIPDEVWDLIPDVPFFGGSDGEDADFDVGDAPSEPLPELGGTNPEFKVPVPPGYDWEVTQGWGQDCQICNDKGYDEVYGDYCSNSTHLYSCCQHSVDFNLPGSADLGVPTVSAGAGHVKFNGVDGNWGQTVVIDYGNNVCGRHAHLQYGSSSHLAIGDPVCQGLPIGAIGGTPSFSPHLHFQFEDCTTGATLPIAFTDGNDVPICTIGEDRYDAYGNYTFLNLTNEIREGCGDVPDPGPDPSLGAICGELAGCPLNDYCGRVGEPIFSDEAIIEPVVLHAANYMWLECALDGKADGSLDPYSNLTRAEALKFSLFLYGAISECTGAETESFADVTPSDWFYQLVGCAESLGLVDSGNAYFRPNDAVTFVEAVTMLVAGAARAGLIEMFYDSSIQHFPAIGPAHWAYDSMETMFRNGGIMRSPESVTVDMLVERGEFIRMETALSPCFCHNVDCAEGCSCNQQFFACMDDSGGSGGAVEDNVLGVDLHFYVDEPRTGCASGRTSFMVLSTLTNNGDADLDVTELEIAIADSDDLAVCQVTKHQMSMYRAVTIPAGESLEFGGYYMILCDEAPLDGVVDLAVDLEETNPGEAPTWYHNLTTSTVIVTDDMIVCGP